MKRNIIAIILVITCMTPLFSCSANNNSTPTPTVTATPTISSTQTASPGGGAVVQSDSIISAQIKAIRKQTSGFPWEIDVLIQSSTDINNLPNPTKDKIGQVITTRTDEDLSAFKVDEVITARVKYVGDVPKPGISLYIYDVKKK